jgi:hypothetical protein
VWLTEFVRKAFKPSSQPVALGAILFSYAFQSKALLGTGDRSLASITEVTLRAEEYGIPLNVRLTMSQLSSFYIGRTVKPSVDQYDIFRARFHAVKHGLLLIANDIDRVKSSY